ncbi:MAG: ribosomal protein S18-alanine N-acetyltransferase [Gemmatimonadaceae bacterium]
MGSARPSLASRDLSCRLRKAAVEDVARIAHIEKASFADPWSTASLTALVGSARVWFSVGETGDPAIVVGYAVAWFVAGEGEIGNLAVVPEARGQGVGGRLLDGVLAAARAAGAENVFLEVRASNLTAQRLYASRGFDVSGRRRSYYRRPVEDALILRKVLAGLSLPR